MTLSARDYLIDRFQDDARILRARANSLTDGPIKPGPDADTSRRMADACEEVAAMVTAITPPEDVRASLTMLEALVPILEKRAHLQKVPAVRAVYVGAATRIREVRLAEQQSDAEGTSGIASVE